MSNIDIKLLDNDTLIRELRSRGLKVAAGRQPVIRLCPCGLRLNGTQWVSHAPTCATLTRGVTVLSGNPNRKKDKWNKTS
jgi:hypothetical protein